MHSKNILYLIFNQYLISQKIFENVLLFLEYQEMLRRSTLFVENKEPFLSSLGATCYARRFFSPVCLLAPVCLLTNRNPLTNNPIRSLCFYVENRTPVLSSVKRSVTWKSGISARLNVIRTGTKVYWPSTIFLLLFIRKSIDFLLFLSHKCRFA